MVRLLINCVRLLGVARYLYADVYVGACWMLSEFYGSGHELDASTVHLPSSESASAAGQPSVSGATPAEAAALAWAWAALRFMDHVGAVRFGVAACALSARVSSSSLLVMLTLIRCGRAHDPPASGSRCRGGARRHSASARLGAAARVRIGRHGEPPRPAGWPARLPHRRALRTCRPTAPQKLQTTGFVHADTRVWHSCQVAQREAVFRLDAAEANEALGWLWMALAARRYIAEASTATKTKAGRRSAPTSRASPDPAGDTPALLELWADLVFR